MWQFLRIMIHRSNNLASIMIYQPNHQERTNQNLIPTSKSIQIMRTNWVRITLPYLDLELDLENKRQGRRDLATNNNTQPPPPLATTILDPARRESVWRGERDGAWERERGERSQRERGRRERRRIGFWVSGIFLQSFALVSKWDEREGNPRSSPLLDRIQAIFLLWTGLGPSHYRLVLCWNATRFEKDTILLGVSSIGLVSRGSI